MPRSYDLNPVAITHHPTQRIDTAIGKLPPFDLQQIVDGFLTALKDLTGIDLTGIRDFLENMFGSIDWSNLPAAGDVWGNVVTTFIDPLINIVQKINELFGPVFGGVDWSDPPTPEELWQQVVSVFIEPLNLLLGPNSPLHAGNLVGQLRAALLGPLPIGMFTDEQLTLLREGGFDDPITIVEGSGYTHDATDGVPGSDPLGCARVECDGQWHIQSFALIKVAPGWTLTTPAQVKYESVVAAANSNAVRIELVPYNGTTPGAAVWMASDESPAGTVDWNDLNAWGQYVVPATGVTDVAVLTVVTPDATAGVVKFDNVDVLAIQKIPQAFTKDLPEDLASLLNFIQTWAHSALTALGITPSGVLLDDILDLSDELEFIQSRAEQGIADAAQALSDFTDFLSGGWQPLLDGVKGATGGGISDIINRLVNITSGGLFDAAKLSNVTGTAPQSLITGLTDLAAQSNQIGDILAGLVVTPINSTVAAIKDWFTGLTGIRDFLENMFGSIDWSNLPDAGDVWQFVVSTFIQPIIDIVGQIGDALNAVLAPIFGGIDFNDLPTPAEVWQTVINTLMLPLNLLLGPGSALNAANLFGRIGMPQLAGGVSLADLTTATSNLLDPFTAESVPSSDGWSFSSGQDAAQVVADGSTKGLWLKSGVIKVEEDQPVNTSVKVKYSGISSGAGQTIRYVLETYESEDGSGPMVPVVVGSITNPTGTISSPVTLGDTSWDIPAGVQSVRPLLEVDELVTAGTVYWVNTPVFRKTLLGVLSDGLPAALQKPLDDLQATWDKFKGAAGGTVDDIEDALNGAGQAIRDAIANALGHSGTGHTSANILTYLQNIPQTVVTGLTGSLGDLQTTLNQIGDIFNNAVVTPINSVVQSVKDWWNQWFGGGSTNAIPLSQKGAANGVATLDSAGNVPLSQLGNVPANGGEPTEHVLFTISASQSIPNGAATSITGWQQVGSVQATFDDGTNTRFTLPKAGWWDIQSQVVWASSTTGKRQSAVVRTLSSGSVIPATSGEDAADHPAWPVRNKIQDIQEVAARGSLAATDKFSVQVYQNSGAALNAVSGYPDGTYVLATYLGEREFEPFSEENVNRTNQPVPSGVAGCWVTLGGGGGGGGGGQKNTRNAYGGGGGGGGAKIFRTWIPVALLGSTYSVTRGALGNGGTGSTTGNGSAGVNGGASTFTSGSVSLSAGGGAGGGGGLSSGGVLGGAGGTASVSGVTATTAAGAAGGPGGSSAGAGVNNTAGGGGGGGGGGSATGSVSPGKGGDSVVATGTALSGADQTGDKPAAGGGGGTSSGSFHEGAAGGFGCGAGGGGGGAGGTAAGADGGYGGRGYTLIEWK